MGKKTMTFNKTGIKPVLYKIKTKSGNTNYAEKGDGKGGRG
jgi:hypothetical protein